MKVVKNKALHSFICEMFMVCGNEYGDRRLNMCSYLYDTVEASGDDIATYLCVKLSINVNLIGEWIASCHNPFGLDTILSRNKSRNKAIISCARKILNERGV